MWPRFCWVWATNAAHGIDQLVSSSQVQQFPHNLCDEDALLLVNDARSANKAFAIDRPDEFAVNVPSRLQAAFNRRRHVHVKRQAASGGGQKNYDENGNVAPHVSSGPVMSAGVL